MLKYFVIHENDAGTEAPTDAYCVSLEQEVAILETANATLDDEIERLQAIVDKYPKNAEGVSVWPGMIQWLCTSPGYTTPQKCRVCSVLKDSAAIVILSGAHWDDVAFCSALYSTRESAEAAKEKE